MNNRLKILLISILIVSAFFSDIKAQEQDTTGTKGLKKYTPRAVRFGISADRLVQTALNNQVNTVAGQVDVMFYKYMLTADYGRVNFSRGPANELQKDYEYNNQGNFLRIGVDYNILSAEGKENKQPDPDGNTFFVGLKYAFASFSDEMSYTRTHSIFEEYTINARNDQLNANWMELNTGLKIQVWKTIHFGFTLQYKFGLNLKGAGELSPYEVPGYGNADSDNRYGFEYYVYYRLPLMK